MRRLRLAAVFVLALLPGCKTRGTESAPSSITPKGEPAGKWLAAVSVGLHVPAKDSERLRNVLQRHFTDTRGGLYRQAFDLSDHEAEAPVTKDVVLARFRDLQEEIASYARLHPAQKTMVVVGLTGHGVSRKGRYTFALEGGTELTDTEIVDAVRGLGAFETLLFVQSCQSGEAFSGLVDGLRTRIEDSGLNVAVLTPASPRVDSPVGAWEDVLERALAGEGFAGDVMTYADVKDRVHRFACESPAYLPLSRAAELPVTLRFADAGLDPQLFERIPPNLPLVLTPAGASKWEAGTLVLPPLEPVQTDVGVSAGTTAVCDLALVGARAFLTADAAAVGAALAVGAEPTLAVRHLGALAYRTFPRRDAYRLLVETLAGSGSAAAYGALRKTLVTMVPSMGPGGAPEDPSEAELSGLAPAARRDLASADDELAMSVVKALRAVVEAGVTSFDVATLKDALAARKGTAAEPLKGALEELLGLLSSGK